MLAWRPDIVIIKRGTNDTKPQNWKYKEGFVANYKEFVRPFKKLPSRPQVFVCYPMPVFEDKWGITGSTVQNEVLPPAVKKIARKTYMRTIDLYMPFLGKANLTYDGVHPNDEGAAFLDRQVDQALQSAKAVNVR